MRNIEFTEIVFKKKHTFISHIVHNFIKISSACSEPGMKAFETALGDISLSLSFKRVFQCIFINSVYLYRGW